MIRRHAEATDVVHEFIVTLDLHAGHRLTISKGRKRRRLQQFARQPRTIEQDTPIDCILAARPDVLVKGGDWPVERIVGAREVVGWGGSVRSIPFVHERSTTSLLARIRAAG